FDFRTTVELRAAPKSPESRRSWSCPELACTIWANARRVSKLRRQPLRARAGSASRTVASCALVGGGPHPARRRLHAARGSAATGHSESSRGRDQASEGRR